jgi:hydrogenase maturation factor
MTSGDLAPHCDHTIGCITCGDEALPMRVVELEGDGLALCADADGNEQTVEVSLVTGVSTGDELLVHAGTALARAAA